MPIRHSDQTQQAMTAGQTPRNDETGRVVGNRSTIRVLQVFSRLAGYQRYAGVTELSRDLGMTKNMVYRALATLVEQGYVVRDPEGLLYSIGPGVINFQSREPLEIDVRAMCRPYLQELHELTGESVFFSIIVGRMRVNTDGIEAHGPRITHVNRGRPLPLHITATGRVLLASLTDEQIKQYIQLAEPLDRYAEGRLRTADQVWTEVQMIRELGYRLDYSDNLIGVNRAVFAAFPLCDSDGRPHGSITVGGPVERFPMTRAQELLPTIERVVRRAQAQVKPLPADPAFLLGEAAGRF